jgi:succinate dehydrogenase assembly factor 2
MARRLLHTTVAARKDPNLQDPYPLPLQSAAGLERDRSPESFTPHPMDGLGDKDIDIDNMRARLVYQTRKRGTLETGLLLSTFATSDRLSKMGADELLELDELLTIPEWTLFYWATGKEELPKDSPWRESKILGLCCGRPI